MFLKFCLTLLSGLLLSRRYQVTFNALTLCLRFIRNTNNDYGMSQNELTSDTEWMRIPTEAFEHKEVRIISLRIKFEEGNLILLCIFD